MKQQGNFIEQMYIYSMIDKSGVLQRYFGVNEVVRGDFAQNRANEKYETHIEKALEWPIKNRWNKELSHISLQSFCTFLNKQERTLRTEELDDRYYPFTIEFESSKKHEESDVFFEVAQYLEYLMKGLNIAEKDIVIIINNNKSVYVMVNPKAFGLKPGKNIHRVYTEMYKKIKEKVSLKFVDESVVNSSYRLIKTPGSFYKGGYINYVSIDEFMHLMTGHLTRKKLTKHQRDIRKLVLPGVQSLKMTRLYEKSKKKVEKSLRDYKKNKNKALDLPGSLECKRECVKALIDMPLMEKGNRNNFLVTIALGLSEANYSEAEIKEVLKRKATEWKHDESLRAVEKKYETLKRNRTNFSCDKVKMLFEEEGLGHICGACKKAINSNYIARNIIEAIYNNKGAVRHYRAYLELEKQKLLGKFFNAEEVGIKERTLKELEKLTNGKFEKKDGLVKITIERGKAIYRLPLDFIESSVDILDQKIGKVLMLIVKAYSGNEYGVFVSTSIIKMAEYLGFKNERSVYAFLNELEKLGFVTKNNNGITVYYKSRKVVSLEEEKENRKEKIRKSIEDIKVVNGLQLEFKFEKIEASTNIQEVNGEIYIFSRMENNKSLNRGSPPS
ncbi:hypothetical protein NSA50_16880 [Clostridium sp. DSM 100503]|uniref:hypothetical protein n=1 Tax=Clostridium sp. DSM 100503 TaxID=2963282 RepID=UPI00214A4827|nr:hypothetical protein [Clostridium sp. DSM 100503]MCR1952702.1 hypothetical protein [Clostridium sp. DSM 100503]